MMYFNNQTMNDQTAKLQAAVALTVVLFLLDPLRNLHISKDETFSRPFSDRPEHSLSNLISDPSAAGIFATFSVPTLFSICTVPATLGVKYNTALRTLIGLTAIGFLGMLSFPIVYNRKMHFRSLAVWQYALLVFFIVVSVMSREYPLLALPLVSILVSTLVTPRLRKHFYIGEIFDFLPFIWFPVVAGLVARHHPENIIGNKQH